jgi:phosphate/sulfate permease
MRAMELIGVAVAWTAAFLGYIKARAFVRNKLRYVDAVQRPAAPWKAGLVAAAIATPIAWVLPIVTTASAVLFGAAVGFGVAAGRRDLRRGLPVNA